MRSFSILSSISTTLDIYPDVETIFTPFVSLPFFTILPFVLCLSDLHPPSLIFLVWVTRRYGCSYHQSRTNPT